VPQPYQLFAVAAPGLEPLLAAELRDLGIGGEVESGGVSWTGDEEAIALANLHLRTATRVLLRVADFRARSFIELERHLRRIDWQPFVGPGSSPRLRVSSRKSRLYHQRAVAERFAREMEQSLGVRVATEARDYDEDSDSPADEENGEVAAVSRREGGSLASRGSLPAEQLIIVRFLRDRCVVSADTSGELLHRRGYRQAVGKAPLRETLAAGLLLSGGWAPDQPLLDPFCGSGTIPIEAALLARNIPPGLARANREPRSYAFQAWPDFDPNRLDRLVVTARTRIRDSAQAPIVGSDRDSGAVHAARENAARAGVSDDVDFAERALSNADVPSAPGWLVTNPPYGIRVGDRVALRNLYASLGQLVRTRLKGWEVTVLSADEALDVQMGLDLREVLRTRNGGNPVRMMSTKNFEF
jgi:putative N6-adenine-specific DNA methylase